MKGQCKCGQKLYLRNGIPVNKLCPKCRKEKAEQKKLKHQQTKTFQESEYRRIHNKAWKLMSLYIRLKDANEYGTNNCYTCLVVKHYTELQAGHFWHDRLDFDERNLKPQCPRCNKQLSGNLAIYSLKLTNCFGEEWMRQLYKDAQNTIYKSSDLIRIISELEPKVKICLDKLTT